MRRQQVNNRVAAAGAAVALVIGVLIGAAGTVLLNGTVSRSPMDAGSMMGGSMMGGLDDMWQFHRQHHGDAR
jgi:hypothetical protein